MVEAGDPYQLLVEALARLPPGERIRLPKHTLPGAPYATWRRSVGYHVKGATFRQWRDGCVHVHETPAEWIIHRDRVSPHESLVEHLRHDCPRTFWVSTAVLGMALAGAMAGAAALVAPKAFAR